MAIQFEKFLALTASLALGAATSGCVDSTGDDDVNGAGGVTAQGGASAGGSEEAAGQPSEAGARASQAGGAGAPAGGVAGGPDEGGSSGAYAGAAADRPGGAGGAEVGGAAGAAKGGQVGSSGQVGAAGQAGSGVQAGAGGQGNQAGVAEVGGADAAGAGGAGQGDGGAAPSACFDDTTECGDAGDECPDCSGLPSDECIDTDPDFDGSYNYVLDSCHEYAYRPGVFESLVGCLEAISDDPCSAEAQVAARACLDDATVSGCETDLAVEVCSEGISGGSPAILESCDDGTLTEAECVDRLSSVDQSYRPQEVADCMDPAGEYYAADFSGDCAARLRDCIE